jgi:hypothetical protein
MDPATIHGASEHARYPRHPPEPTIKNGHDRARHLAADSRATRTTQFDVLSREGFIQ